MQAVRQILEAEQIAPFIDMPQNMRHGQVEIIVFPFFNIDAPHPIPPPSASTAHKKSARFPNLALDMHGFTFDREEANEG
jgi:hypothetical protein